MDAREAHVLDSQADPLAALARFSTISRRNSSELYPAFGNSVSLLVNVLASLVIIGQALLVLLLVTLLISKRLGRRNPTLQNLILVSIIAGFPGLLLVYSGNVFVKKVPQMTCLTQATLKNGVDTMFIVAPLALVIELYLSTKTATQRRIAFRRVALVALPYVTFFGFAIWTVVTGMRYPGLVVHDTNDLYCELKSHSVSLGLNVFGIAIVAATIGMQVMTALALRQILRSSERSKESTAISISILYRLAGYTVVQVLYLAIACLSYVEPERMVLVHDFYEACMPLMVFLVYGLSPDILRVWFCMGPRNAPINAQSISNPRPWTMVSGSLTDSKLILNPALATNSDLEKGRSSMQNTRTSVSHTRVGSDAGSQFSWDPRWERASRFGASPSEPAPFVLQPAPTRPSRSPRTLQAEPGVERTL